ASDLERPEQRTVCLVSNDAIPGYLDRPRPEEAVTVSRLESLPSGYRRQRWLSYVLAATNSSSTCLTLRTWRAFTAIFGERGRRFARSRCSTTPMGPSASRLASRSVPAFPGLSRSGSC